MSAFRLEDISNTERAASLTSHITEYIPSDIIQLASSSSLRLLAAREADSNEIYILQWYIDGNTWRQRAWHKWEVTDATVEHMFITGKYMYLICKNTDTGFKYYMSIDMTNQSQLGYGQTVHLDNWQTIPSDAWTQDGLIHYMTQPISLVDTSMVLLGKYAAGVYAHADLPVEYNINDSRWETSIFVDADVEPFDCILGSVFESYVSPTQPFVKDTEGESRLDNPIRLSQYDVHVVNSGSFLAILAYDYMDDIEMELNTGMLGILNIDEEQLLSGPVPVPLYCKNTELDLTFKSSRHYPMNILNIVWRGMYTQRGRWV